MQGCQEAIFNGKNLVDGRARISLEWECSIEEKGSTQRLYYGQWPQGYVYIGSTSDLIKRVWEHKNKVIPGFTARYNAGILVYYEVHESYVEAARREKRFKNWCRQWKLNLIEELIHNGVIYM